MNEDKIGFPARLNRYIASCGVTSRRKADELIESGRVTVDGLPETSMGRVLSGDERVCVDGRDITPTRHVYIVMNKPRGILSAAADLRGVTVVDLLPGHYRKLGVYPAGRLDKESEGLIILTNDGSFTYEIVHPSGGVNKTYCVTLRQDLDQEGVDTWMGGIVVEERLLRPLEITPLDGLPGKRFNVVLGDGYKREIRLMAQALGNRVHSLTRTAIGNLCLKKLPLGAFNEYNYAEIKRMIHDGGEI